MLNVIAKCDHCEKQKGFTGVNLVPNYQTICSLLKKLGWVITNCCQFCSDECRGDFQLTCEHDVVMKDGFTECIKCGKTWEPDYDLLREGK